MKHSKRVKKLEKRQSDFDTMVLDQRCTAAMQGRDKGYHRPGSVKK